MKNVKYNINKIPFVYYSNIEKYKYIIYKENKGKQGIYLLYNKITSEFYIGSSLNLTNRFYSYLGYKYLRKKVLNSKSQICNSLLKYGYSNFSLYILEYSDSNLLNREQYYIDLLKPEYNIRKAIKSSLLSTKH